MDNNGFDITYTSLVKFENIISNNRLQTALNPVAEWYKKANLNINSKKSHHSCIHQTQGQGNRKNPSIFVEKIKYSKEVKLIGITQDEKLTVRMYN